MQLLELGIPEAKKPKGKGKKNKREPDPYSWDDGGQEDTHLFVY